ncbi:ScbR family autoregulator-binding transcription factor [Streptomyces sp. NBC_01233]|uniref:ScbR family autoregulator-binding transcription factor n=1 Tax=Streptomyces sp. NBC_01233 TaxID=2903787 RepID=UPI002E112DAC|nr:TetR family transcriptional regulator [Streptomyces sp. NBC_01233]
MAKQERALRTRETLVQCAAETFDREGFTNASLTKISTQAGVSNGAIHFHFASKAALADAVEDAALLRLRAVTEKASPDGSSYLQHLVGVTHGLARELRGDIVLRAGFKLSGDAARPRRTDLRAYLHRWVEEEVGHAWAEGELRPGVAPEGAVTAVVGTIAGFEALGTRDPTWLSPRTVAQFWELLLPSLASWEVLGRIEAEDGASSRSKILVLAPPTLTVSAETPCLSGQSGGVRQETPQHGQHHPDTRLQRRSGAEAEAADVPRGMQTADRRRVRRRAFR